MKHLLAPFILIFAMVTACGDNANPSKTFDDRDAANACWMDTETHNPGEMSYTLQKYSGQPGRWYVGIVQPGVEYLHHDFTETARTAAYLKLTLQGGEGAGTDLGLKYRVSATALEKFVDGSWVHVLNGAWRTCS